eukprot:103516-Rhodomonas_salina.1
MGAASCRAVLPTLLLPPSALMGTGRSWAACAGSYLVLGEESSNATNCCQFPPPIAAVLAARVGVALLTPSRFRADDPVRPSGGRESPPSRFLPDDSVPRIGRVFPFCGNACSRGLCWDAEPAKRCFSPYTGRMGGGLVSPYTGSGCGCGVPAS